MKSYTDLQQSKVLAKILPLESADMLWMKETKYYYEAVNVPYIESTAEEDDGLPCWSLASLLSVLPNGIVMNKDSQTGRYHFSSTHVGTYVTADNPIDACVAMIERLNELNLL